jgi:hypothetical protein
MFGLLHTSRQNNFYLCIAPTWCVQPKNPGARSLLPAWAMPASTRIAMKHGLWICRHDQASIRSAREGRDAALDLAGAA